MKQIISLFLILCFGWTIAIGQQAEQNIIDNKAKKYIKKRKNKALVIGVVQNGVVTIKGYGHLGNENKSKPDANTIFEIGAISDVFTTTLMAQQMQTDKIDISKSVKSYLPKDIELPHYQSMRCTIIELPPGVDMDGVGHPYFIRNCTPDPLSPSFDFSFCDLATHTAGFYSPIKSYDWKPFFYKKIKGEPNYLTTEVFYDQVKNIMLVGEPGIKYRYSTFGMALLGNALAEINHQSYESVLIENVLTPLDLKDTRISLTANQMKRLAPGHNYKGRTVASWSLNAMSPAGGIKSSAKDLLRFVELNMNCDDPVFEAVFEQVQQGRISANEEKRKQLTDSGYGWLITPLNKKTNQPITWMNGGTEGYRAFIGFAKDSKVGVVVLSNSAKSVDDLGFEILGLLVQPIAKTKPKVVARN